MIPEGRKEEEEESSHFFMLFFVGTNNAGISLWSMF